MSTGQREFNRTRDDPCAMQTRQNENDKKLKFVTTNFGDLLQARESYNFFGLGVRDQLFVPSEKVDTYSALRQGTEGNIITNCNVRHGFGQFPVPTMPARYQLSRGDVETEDTLRNYTETNSQPCNPRDITFHDRSFYIFDPATGVEIPNALKSVETQPLEPRGGRSTRFIKASRR